MSMVEWVGTGFIAAVLMALIGILWKYQTRVDSRLLKIEIEMADAKVKRELMWKVMEEKLVDNLKCPDKLPMDILLDKFKARELTLSEAQDLRTMLNEEYARCPNDKAIAYTLVLGRLEEIIYGLKVVNDRNCSNVRHTNPNLGHTR